MPTLSPQAQALITQFGQHPGVTPDQLSNLQNVINGSAALVDEVNAAVAAGHLQHFAALPAGTHAGGTYSGGTKTINLPLSTLTTPTYAPYNPAEVTFVLGHEIQHGFNHTATMQAYATFRTEAETAAKTNHDYTTPIGNLIEANRRDEAAAEIAGWNALVGMVKGANQNATLAHVYNASPRSYDFVSRNPGPPSTYTLNPNLAINPDLTIATTTANIEGMGQNYFDKAPLNTGLGHHGNSDYANYYGAYAIGVASQLEQAHTQPGVASQMTVNMAQLRLSEKLMEENGINLGTGLPAPQPYVDNSTTPPTRHHFDHTKATYTFVPIAAQEFERQRSSLETSHPNLEPSNSAHPDHAMLEQIRAGVRTIDGKIGKSYDDMSERISRSLLAQCKDQRDMYPNTSDVPLSANALNRVDHVLMGETGNIFVVEGRLDDPAHKRACVPVEQGIRTPVEQSDHKLQAANQIIFQEREMGRQQELARGPDDPSRGGPAMTR